VNHQDVERIASHNEQRQQEYASSDLIQLLTDENTAGETKKAVLTYLQPWSNAFQRMISARVTFETDPALRTLALELAPYMIRVNSIHPTQVDTPMIQNEATYRLFRPDLEHPTREDFAPASQSVNALPIPWVEPVDISNAVLFLASDEGRYITGVTLPVDAGTVIK